MTITRPLENIIDEKDIKAFRLFMNELTKGEKRYFLRNEIMHQFEFLCKSCPLDYKFSTKSSLYRFFNKTQEIIFLDHKAVFLFRREIAKYKVYVIHENNNHVEEANISEFLDLKDNLVHPETLDPSQKVSIDFLSFYDYGPTINDSKKVGKGIDFLNNYMSGNFIHNPEKFKKTLYEFLKIHSMNGQQLLLNDKVILNENQLNESVKEFLLWLEDRKDIIDITTVEKKIKYFGFNIGFGKTINEIKESMHLLLELLEAPNSKILEQFISRIPMISKIAIISPHGWFGQENVMGRPDTGGQVIYILDQVRALEAQLIKELESSGLNNITPKILVVTRLIPNNEGTSSNERIEKIHDTFNCWILRIPFTTPDAHVVDHWISRFKIWNYLERFALNAKKELLKEFGGKPDLIIGNYSDGNLVASLLSDQLEVIQCNIAHALEKPKYLFSALYWEDLEFDYNFSMQFTADLIAMNRANFIITSTLQEIIGTDTTIGQYESYQFFTLPNLYKITGGTNLFHPKFNVIPPGIDERIYFPNYQKKRRDKKLTEQLTQLLFANQDEETLGTFDDPEKPPIFAMSRLDKVKNITGFVEAYGKDKNLQEMANLIVIAGRLREEDTNDPEEQDQLRMMYHLINEYQLEGKIRWIGKFLPKTDTGEIYRIIADKKGIFVQPALFEAFGLTILEAMASGLPAFATQFGGPLEIIEDNISGFLINPTKHEELCSKMQSFLKAAQKNPRNWDKISRNAIKRIKEQYNWGLYAANMLKLTKLYGFWKYSSSAKGKSKMSKYCELLFHLIFKERAKRLEEG